MHQNLQRWTDDALNRLEQLPCGYRENDVIATEPTALATLALATSGRIDPASVGIAWLASQQRPDGSIAPLCDLQWPGWPTSLAILATAVFTTPDSAESTSNKSKEKSLDLELAKQWLLAAAGKPLPSASEFGHDMQLVGWAWAVGTHSWVEPTAWSVLALKSLGMSQHPRTREGVRLLVDRLLSTGGCNYGNTVVLGQRLRPHVEPTGLTMLALAGETINDPRIERSLGYLQSALSAETTPISLSYGLLGLAAFDRMPTNADEWLIKKYREVIERDRSPLKLAMLILAAQGNKRLLKVIQHK